MFEHLPLEHAEEFYSDTNFRLSLDDFQPGRGRMVHLPDPGPTGTSRCVVLKPRLDRCSKEFACYIIAHELAHAKLNNGGWEEITDREEAADALAESWGFSRVNYE